MKIKNYQIAIFFTIFCLMLFFGKILYNYNRVLKIGEKYPNLEIYDSVNGVVKELPKFEGFKASPYCSIIVLSNNKRYSIQAKYNPIYSNKGISDVIELEDSISKNQNNDTIKIFKKNNQEYFFILNPD